ncbi:TPA: hypothetical protein N0F65_003062, partial [Lagenidium giganteum]
QTYQAYRLSYYVSSVRVNTSILVILVLNCVSTTPIALHCLRGQPTLDRFVYLMIDIVLDTLSCVVVPSYIFAPYVSAFNVATHTFSQQLEYDDIWFVVTVMENKQLFVMSSADSMSRAIPFVSIVSYCSKIKYLLTRAMDASEAVSSIQVLPQGVRHVRIDSMTGMDVSVARNHCNECYTIGLITHVIKGVLYICC